MPIKAIETQRLYRQISDQLRSLIVAGEFPVGSRLPAERDLAVQLGVSRPSLREALIALEVQGYIEVHMGSGIYVCKPPAVRAKAPDISREEGPLELIRARALLEGEVAATAARVGRKPQFDAIADAIKTMAEVAGTGATPIEPTSSSTCASPKPQATASWSTSWRDCSTSAWARCSTSCTAISKPPRSGPTPSKNTRRS
jgi:DNA-binding FadR family transcriptional regulator